MADTTPRNSAVETREGRPRISIIADIDGKNQMNLGRRVGNYVLGRTIGAGTTGRVKIASHIVTGEKVAIKIIPRESDAVKRLDREITAMRLIKHPNVVRLYDVYEDDKHLYSKFDKIFDSGLCRRW